MMVKKTKTNDGKLTALGCHIYAGGFSIGVRAAGFKLLGHMEEWPFGVATSKKNLGVKVYQGLETWDEAVEEHAGKVDWLYGNPPCASWSAAGVKVKDKSMNENRWAKDSRTDCARRLFALVPRIRPTAFTWESVAAAMKNGIEFVDERTEEMVDQGFHVYRVLFNGKDCGLPQTRKRFFFVASKVAMDFQAPDADPFLPRDAWADLEDPGKIIPIRQDLVKLLKRIPKNEAAVLAKYFMKEWKGREDEMPRDPKTGNVKGRPGFLHQRVSLDEIAPTVTGGQHLYHPLEPRALTPLEQQLLCGYPADYEFVGAPSAQYSQIGKAVLPPAAKWLAKTVMRGLKAGRKVKPGMTDHDFITGR